MYKTVKRWMQGMAGSGCFNILLESLLRMALPVGLKFVLHFIFRAAKEYPDACEATRIDIDRKLSAALKEWREE